MMLTNRRRAPTRLAGAAWLLTRAAGRLALVSAEIRLLGFQHYLQRVPPAGAAPVATSAVARSRRYARSIDRASRCPLLPAHCLERSAALHWWLRRDGLPSELRIGVRRQGGQIAAHAWVELDGAPINDRPEALTPFLPLFTERASPGAAGTAQTPP